MRTRIELRWILLSSAFLLLGAIWTWVRWMIASLSEWPEWRSTDFEVL